MIRCIAVLIFLSSASFSSISQAQTPGGLRRCPAGGADGGGTTAIFPQGETSPPILLEAFLARHDFIDPEVRRSRQFTHSRWITQHGIDSFNPQDEPGFLLAQQRLSVWESSSPITVKALRTTLSHTLYWFTYWDLGLLPEYEAPASIPAGTLKTAVFYSPAVGAVFSANIYPRLGLTSQAGTFIHEALRQIQLAYGDGMSNRSLQKVTAKVLLSDPQPGETLDDPSLYGRWLGAWINASGSGSVRQQQDLCLELRSFVLSNASSLIEPDRSVLRGIENQACSSGTLSAGSRHEIYVALLDQEVNLLGSQSPLSQMDKTLFATLVSMAWNLSSESVIDALSANDPLIHEIGASAQILRHALGQLNRF